MSHGAGAGRAGLVGRGGTTGTSPAWDGVGLRPGRLRDDVDAGGLGGDRRGRLRLRLGGAAGGARGSGSAAHGGCDSGSGAAAARQRRARRARRRGRAPRPRPRARRGLRRRDRDPAPRAASAATARGFGCAATASSETAATSAAAAMAEAMVSGSASTTRLRLRLGVARDGRERQVVVDDDGSAVGAVTASAATCVHGLLGRHPRLVLGDRVLEALAGGDPEDRRSRHPRRRPARLAPRLELGAGVASSASAARSSSVSAIAAAPATAAAAAVAAPRSNSSSSPTASTVASVSASSSPSAREQAGRRTGPRRARPRRGRCRWSRTGPAACPRTSGRRTRRRRAPAPPCPGCGAHVRQRPSGVFQQSPHVYWRQVRQKLNVWWNASSWCVTAVNSSSLRASAIASEKDASSERTKLFRPLLSVRTLPSRERRGAADSKV